MPNQIQALNQDSKDSLSNIFFFLKKIWGILFIFADVCIGWNFHIKHLLRENFKKNTKNMYNQMEFCFSGFRFFYLRKDILNLIKFIFSIGFLKFYPLLFHFASFVDYIQNENISCVELMIVINYFLYTIKNSFQELLG